MEIDQFMKELAVESLEEILELFFPRVARRLDFSQKKDLNKQLYTDSPKGVERFVDVLLEVGVKKPPPAVFLIHIESQQQRRFDFPARMMGYHCLIYVREIEGERQDSFDLSEFTAWQKQKRLLSFVFCNYPLKGGIISEKYQTGVPQTRLSGRYMCISLPMLSAMDYLQKDQVVVCALAVFMNPAGFSQPELKVACYLKLINYLPHLTRKKYDLIVHAVETYVLLTDAEKEVYQRLSREVYPEVSQMITNPLIEQGRQEGLQESILKILSHRFLELPSEIGSRILVLKDTEKLERLLGAALEVDSPEELMTDGFFD